MTKRTKSKVLKFNNSKNNRNSLFIKGSKRSLLLSRKQSGEPENPFKIKNLFFRRPMEQINQNIQLMEMCLQKIEANRFESKMQQRINRIQSVKNIKHSLAKTRNSTNAFVS